MIRRILCILTLLLVPALFITTTASQPAYASSQASAARPTSAVPAAETTTAKELGAASTAVSRLLADWNSNQSLFDLGNGKKCPTVNTGGNCWWWSANAWMALVSYAEEHSKSADATKIKSDLATSYRNICAGQCPTAADQNGKDPFTVNTAGNTWFDDIGWWEQMWLNAYQLTKTKNYLYLAEELWNYVTTNGFKAKGCGGVVQHHDKNGPPGGSGADAFANSLYLRNSAWLYFVTGQSVYMTGDSHGGGAIYEAGWIRSELIFHYAGPAPGSAGSQFMVADHLTSGCTAAGDLSALQTQGEMVNAWTDMYAACKKYGCPTTASYYNRLANELALTVIRDTPAQNATYRSHHDQGQSEPTVDGQGILSEPCDPTTKGAWPRTCDLGNALGGKHPYKSYLISKGIFERAIYCSNHNLNDSALTSFAAKNAASIAGLPHFGFLWDSSAANAPVIFPTQTSVLDGLDAHLGGSYAMC